jgi:hypothetical protein
MTTLYLDGFDTYGSGAVGVTNMLDGAWADVSILSGPDTPTWGARTGEFALTSRDPGGDAARLVLPATKTRVFLSCGFAVNKLPSVNFSNEICSFRDGANAVIANLWVQSTGVVVLAAANGTVLASTQGPVIVAQNWHYLEMDFNIAGQAFVLRVDDPTGAATPQINVGGLALVGPVAQLAFLGGFLGNAVTSWLDDLFVRDALGATNNTFLGDRRIATLLADADTTAAGWTPRYYQKLGAGILNDTTANACISAATDPSLNVGLGDFTIESFVRFQSLPTGANKAVIFGKWDETANQRSYQLFLGSVALNGGALCFQTSTDGTVSTVLQPIVYPFTPELDTWYHIALVRSAGNLLLFVNGQQLGLPIASALAYFAGAAPVGLGGQVETAGGAIANTSVAGWFDEARFTVGFARYTANFAPTVVEFPRNVAGDPQFADVALLCGFDSLIQDESSFGRALTARNGAVQKTVSDGPLVGVFSTIGKAVPDDNTFVEAPFLAASSILTLAAQPANADTVTVGTKAGPAAAVYTFKNVLAAAFDVLIDTTLQQTLQNLFNAINAGPGAGAKYGTGTTANLDVVASQLPAGQMAVTADTLGTGGNAVATSAVLTHGGGWTGATLSGGTNIPAASEFKVQRPPPLTTIISAVQISQRAFKSDAGICSVNSALIGPLGGVTAAAAHNLTVSPSYYNDIYETDPDTAASITAATLINGRIRINRQT